jgi:predicted transcriptional regulator
MSKCRYTAKEIIAAVRKNKGILTLVARELGCTRQTVHNYVKRYPTIAAAVQEERDSLLDLAEGKLFEQVNKGNMTAIIFTLKTLGKHRGYIERRDVDVTTGGEPLNIIVKWDEHEDD